MQEPEGFTDSGKEDYVVGIVSDLWNITSNI